MKSGKTWILNKFIKLLILCFSVVVLPACSTAIKDLYPAKSCDETKTIYVDSHGWHTGIIVAVEDLNHHLSEIKQDFLGAKHLEIGWGDRGYYQADEITSGLTMSAMLWPTDSILHVVGFHGSPKEVFHNSEVIELQVSTEGLDRMLEFIDNTFERNTEGYIISKKAGLYGWSQFYEAKGNFHLFSTCNYWVADAVRKTGFPISTFYAMTATNVLYQLENYAYESLNCF